MSEADGPGDEHEPRAAGRDGRRLAVVSAATVGIAALFVVFVDRPLALWLKATLPPAVVAVFDAVAQLGVATGYAVGAAVLAVVFWLGARQVRVPAVAARLRFYARRALFVLAALAASGLLLNVIKVALGRLRPRLLFNEGLYGFQPFNTDFGDNALPSGHAQTIWAVATALMICFPGWRWPLAAVAVVVSLARVMQTAHYLSDVLVGAVLAIVVTLLVERHLFARRGYPVRPQPGEARGER